MRKITFEPVAFQEFTDWYAIDKAIANKIVKLINETRRTPFEGTGQPEPLKHNLAGYWSRRINLEHRLVYKVTDFEIIISSCKGHYE